MSLSDFGVLEGGHFELLRHSAVAPFEDFVIGEVSEGLEDVLPEQLPDDSEDEFFFAVNEVNSSDVDELDLEELADFESVIGVLDLDDSGLGGLGDLLPVNASWK